MMKNLFKTMAFLFLSVNIMATTLTENFDTFTPGTYGNYTHNGWSINNGISENTVGRFIGTRAVRLNQNPGTFLKSPSKTGGVGTINFQYRHWDGTPAISKIYIEVSNDDVTWTKVDSVVGFLATTFTSYSKVVNSATAQYVRISPSGEDRLILDEFSITDTAVACSGYFIDSVATEICAFDSVEFRGTFYKTDGIYKDTVTSTCDTIFILNLSTTIYTSYDVFDTICSVDDSVLFNGVYLKTAGIYYDTTIRAGNCDSISKLMLSTKYCPVACEELFISEYIEGSSFNKALEIYNPTNSSVDLTVYSIIVYSTIKDTIDLTGMLASGDVYVIGHGAATLAGINSNSDVTFGFSFNGDDVIELLKNGVVIDRFGDPSFVGNFAQNQTFQRKSMIQSGSLVYSATDWNILAQDTDTEIGAHESDCICTIERDTTSTTICQGSSVVFDGQTLTMTGFYSDTIIGGAVSGCDSISVLNLTVSDYIRDTTSTTICQGSSVVFDGQTLTMTGFYSDTIIAGSSIGCDSISVLNLTVSDYIRDTTSTTICDGQSVVFDGQTLTMTGFYSDTLQNAGGCDSISVLNLTVTTIDNTVTTSGVTLTANDADANTTYVWVDCDNSYAAITPAETGQSYTAAANGNYAVILTNGSCVDTSACISLNTVGINDVSNEIGASIYPNPTTDLVNIKVGKLGVYSLTVMDVTGKVVMTKTVTNELSQLDFNGYDSGVYFITLYNNTQKTTFKLTVK